MDRFEYLALAASQNPSENVRASVRLEDGAFMPERDIDLHRFLTLLALHGPSIEFDEHPFNLVEVRLDFDQRRLKLKARRKTLASLNHP